MTFWIGIGVAAIGLAIFGFCMFRTAKQADLALVMPDITTPEALRKLLAKAHAEMEQQSEVRAHAMSADLWFLAGYVTGLLVSYGYARLGAHAMKPDYKAKWIAAFAVGAVRAGQGSVARGRSVLLPRGALRSSRSGTGTAAGEWIRRSRRRPSQLALDVVRDFREGCALVVHAGDVALGEHVRVAIKLGDECAQALVIPYPPALDVSANHVAFGLLSSSDSPTNWHTQRCRNSARDARRPDDIPAALIEAKFQAAKAWQRYQRAVSEAGR